MKKFCFPRLIAAALLALLAACNAPQRPLDAHVVVVGAGPAGLAAALELARGGVSVVVVDANSVGGGHGVMAGGLALVDTPLQEKRGFTDSPERAFADWMAWGEDNDPGWTRAYAEQSRSQVYDWLTDMGVQFVALIPTPENSVPRFHFTRGKAVHAILPLFRQALDMPNIRFVWNSRVTRLITEKGAVTGVEMTNLRTGHTASLTALGVILATGGNQGDLEKVAAAWPADTPRPDPLLVGAGHFADGSGRDLAVEAGAALRHPDRQVIFLGGLRNPRDPSGRRALVASSREALWVNAQGRRFTNEAAPDKINGARVLAQKPARYWMILDANTIDRLSVRDALWLDRATLTAEIVNNPDITVSAPDLATLARQAGLPPAALSATLARYNALIDAGEDVDFGRFTAQTSRPPRLDTPPFYAIQLFPLTRKSLGGIAVDHAARAVTAEGAPVPGLYAAGEVTGVAGINGRYGMSGTFVGPAIFMGRVAARAFLADHEHAAATALSPAPKAAMPAPAAGMEDLAEQIAQRRPGYWHFEQAHSLVIERRLSCTQCHTDTQSMAPALSKAAMRARTTTCLTCH